MTTHTITLRIKSSLPRAEIVERLVELWLLNRGDKYHGDYMRRRRGEKRIDADEVGVFSVVAEPKARTER